MESPDQFIMALFSKMFLTNEEVETLMKELHSTPLKDKEKAIQNFHIMLIVHRKISENSQLFYILCDVLESLYLVRFKVKLQGTGKMLYLKKFTTVIFFIISDTLKKQITPS